jgi:hypothetical protein
MKNQKDAKVDNMKMFNKLSMITLMAVLLVAVSASGVFAMPSHGTIAYGPQNYVILFSSNNPVYLGVNTWNSNYTADVIPTNFSFDSYVGSAPTMAISYDDLSNISIYNAPYSNVQSGVTEYVISSPWDQYIDSSQGVNYNPL